MNRRNDNPAGEPCRDWKDTLVDLLLLLTILIFGLAIGIGLCKFVPGFWEFVSRGAWG